MIDLAIITGTGFYDFPGMEKAEDILVSTEFGECALRTGLVKKTKIAFLARHGKNHGILSSSINYRANLLALNKLGTKAIISTTVCGVLDQAIPLGSLVVFDDLYFPENRLPNGELCTLFVESDAKSRGHYIFNRPFNESLRQQIIKAAEKPFTEAVYAHVGGPRFNSKPEISALRQFASFVSQTAGPEVVFSGELGIPLSLIGFGVDYANGVSEEPTPVEVLKNNLKKSKKVFLEVIMRLLEAYEVPSFEGFIYRFE
jgi:5'-methylthioadenosine phosphorylase